MFVNSAKELIVLDAETPCRRCRQPSSLQHEVTIMPRSESTS